MRSLEKVFGELVLGVKWVEEGALRKKTSEREPW